MHSVLFVCAGNVCRSPMAQGLLRAKVGNDDHWRIESAGTWPVEGDSVSENTARVLLLRGIILKSHAARVVTGDLLRSFQLILTMERGQKEAIQVEFPAVARRVFMLSEMIGENFNIEDPYGSPLVEYEETARDMEQIISLGFTKISQYSEVPE